MFHYHLVGKLKLAHISITARQSGQHQAKKNKNVMLPSSGKFEILGRSVDFFVYLLFIFYFLFFTVSFMSLKLITKCTSFVNQSIMTQSKENKQ